MSKYAAKIETYTRDEALEVCSIIASGIDKESLSARANTVFIDSGKKPSFSNGKSLIVDGTTAALSDDHKCQNISEDRLVEKKPLLAISGKAVTQLFNIASTQIPVSIRYIEHHSSYRYPDSSLGLNFYTSNDYFRMHRDHETICPDLLIHFVTIGSKFNWDRAWTISAQSDAFKTDQMADAMAQLNERYPRKMPALACA